MKNNIKKAAGILCAAAMICGMLGGCTLEQAVDTADDYLNSMQTADSEEVLSVKNAYLTSYSSTVTVGDALDNFLANSRWQYFTGEDGEEIVECTGECVYQEKNVEAKIQFLLNDDGTFEINAMGFNDIAQTPLVIAAFFTKVYEEAESIAPTDAADDTSSIDTAASVSQSSSSDAGGDTIDIKDIESYWFNSQYVTEDVLDTMSQDEVRTMLNALYAYHGYTFTTEYYQKYFAAMSWYLPLDSSMEDCEAEFNEYETANKNTIVAYEQAKGWR